MTQDVKIIGRCLVTKSLIGAVFGARGLFHKNLYSTGNIPGKITPVKSYDNAGSLKERILAENRNLSGIYRWENKINGNVYVGSGVDLAKRLGIYYRNSELTRNTRPIHQALLKYGHDNFRLDILEYCLSGEGRFAEKANTVIIKREQYYLDLLEPEYNILKFAYSLQGFKHSEESIALFKSKKISSKHKEILSLTHKGKIVSEETREKLARATIEYKKNNPLTVEALANIRAKTIEREGISVTVLNTETKELKVFSNQTEAGVFLGVSRQAVYNAEEVN